MNLHAFDLNLLLAFDAISRRQSISGAAVELGITQPAVSAALKRLRDHLGDPLFVRTAYGMRPTPFADDMQPRVTDALRLLREIDHPATFVPETARVEYKIYIGDAGMLTLLPAVVKHIGTHAPRTTLTIIDLRHDEVVPALDGGRIDLAVGYFADMPNWARQQSLRITSYVCAVRRDHPVIGETLSLEQFRNAKHCVYRTSGSSHNALDRSIARGTLRRSVPLLVPNFTVIPFVIAESDLIATIPEDLAATFGSMMNIRLLPPPLALPRFRRKQYWHERNHMDPAFRWLRKVFKTQAAEAEVDREEMGASES